jgi:nucleoside-diphosphate-sugar epimerase
MVASTISNQGQRVLVAGGAGFIGSNLCERLLSLGHDVTCLDNLATGREVNIRALLADPRFTFILADIIEELPVMRGFDRVYHLASPASPPGYQRMQIETLRVNSEGTRRLLELARADHCRLLFASTSEAYGDPLEHPQKETYRGNVSSTGPRSMYDEAKRFGEAMTMAYVREFGLDARIVRIFNTYGPQSDPQDGRLVPNFIMQALRGDALTVYGDGRQTRSLCYVSDLVEGLISAMECDDATGEVVNLGNPEEHDIVSYAELVIQLVGSTSRLEWGPVAVGDDPQRRRPDISKAQDILGWAPKVGLREGLCRTIDYFRECASAPLKNETPPGDSTLTLLRDSTMLVGTGAPGAVH